MSEISDRLGRAVRIADKAGSIMRYAKRVHEMAIELNNEAVVELRAAREAAICEDLDVKPHAETLRDA